MSAPSEFRGSHQAKLIREALANLARRGFTRPSSVLGGQPLILEDDPDFKRIEELAAASVYRIKNADSGPLQKRNMKLKQFIDKFGPEVEPAVIVAALFREGFYSASTSKTDVYRRVNRLRGQVAMHGAL